MPTTDTYGQGISLASLTDAPDLPRAVGDLAAGVIPRSVMRFASASERGATITAPVEGMLAWLRDVNLLTLYDGTAWVAIAAGTQAWTTVPLASGWTHDGNSNGTFQYRVVNMFGEKVLMFRGAIARSSYPGSMPTFFQLNTTVLPESAQPASLRTISVPCSDISSERITLKLDVTVNGELKLYGANSTSKPPWVGFNGCFTSL